MDLIYGEITLEQVKESAYVGFAILKDEVERKDYERVDQLFETLHKVGIEAKNKISLSFMGFDSDRREIFQIPVIRKYVSTLYEKHPDIFYFTLIADHTAKVVLCCMLEVVSSTASNGTTQIEIKPNYDFFQKVQLDINAYAATQNDMIPVTVMNILSS